MLFQKSFISFVAAIALATSVSASFIAARDIVPQCPAGLTPYCCTSSPSFSGLGDAPKEALTNNGGVDQSKPLCEGCSTPPVQGWYCVFFPYRMKMANASVVPMCRSAALASSPLVRVSSFSACGDELSDKLIIRWPAYWL